MCAYWARPEKYLDERVRSAISTFSRIGDVSAGVKKLSRDLNTGEWNRRYGSLQKLSEFDFGYRLITSELNDTSTP
jgi:hypothetical protein